MGTEAPHRANHPTHPIKLAFHHFDFLCAMSVSHFIYWLLVWFFVDLYKLKLDRNCYLYVIPTPHGMAGVL
jgi:hypothetical protein